MIDEEIKKNYDELINIIGEGALALIHFVHMEQFTFELEKLKNDVRKEIIKELNDAIDIASDKNEDTYELDSELINAVFIWIDEKEKEIEEFKNE